jgi:hypothetical protein
MELQEDDEDDGRHTGRGDDESEDERDA